MRMAEVDRMPFKESKEEHPEEEVVVLDDSAR